MSEELGKGRLEFHATALPPRDPADLIGLAEQAEALGYDRFWVADQGFGPDPFVLLQALAAHTRLPLGLAVTSPFTRHPVQIARAIATLAALEPERRWVLALGLANPQHVLAPLGIEARNAPAQLAAATRLVRALVDGDAAHCDDPALSFRCDGVRLELAPARARVDLYIGTRGPRILRDAAGACADGAIVESLFTPAGIAWARERLDAGSRAAGRGAYARPYIAWQVTEVTDAGPSAEAQAFAARLMAASAPAMLDRLGVPADVIAAAKRDGAARVAPEELRKLVAARSAEELRATVGAAAAAGATAWGAVFMGDPSVAAERMRRFGEAVVAPLRAGSTANQQRGQ